jgi:hypothetical protein
MVVNLQLSECSVPVLALNHFHLELIYVKLLFLNCTLFTLLVFILFLLASDYFDERKIFLLALSMQIAAILVLTSIGLTWNHITSAQNYILLLYICLGMPYFAFPFSNSILSKITDARNASRAKRVVLSRHVLRSIAIGEPDLPCRCQFREHKRKFDNLLFCFNVSLVAWVNMVCCTLQAICCERRKTGIINRFLGN